MSDTSERVPVTAEQERPGIHIGTICGVCCVSDGHSEDCPVPFALSGRLEDNPYYKKGRKSMEAELERVRALKPEASNSLATVPMPSLNYKTGADGYVHIKPSEMEVIEAAFMAMKDDLEKLRKKPEASQETKWEKLKARINASNSVIPEKLRWAFNEMIAELEDAE